jgi:drug/metabolite transporter (DMT)-like permease
MSRETLGLLLGFVGVVIFGGTLPATRIAVAELHPWFVTAGRAVVAAGLAALYLMLWRRPRPPAGQGGAILLVAVCLVYGFPGLSTLAMQTVPASRGGVVLAILPLATAAAAALVAGERPSRLFWLCAVAGSTLVTIFALRGGDGGFRLGIGEAYLLAAVVVTGLGYAVSGKLAREMGALDVTSWALLLALPLSLAISWATMPAAPGAVPARAWIAFAYTGVFSMFIGFLFWNAGLAMGGIAKVGQVQLLQSFVTLAIAATIVGETIGADTLLFALAVFAIVLIGRRAAVKRS